MTNLSTLIEKLTDIERSIGVESNYVLLSKVIDAHDCALQMQKDALGATRREPTQEVAQGFLEKLGLFSRKTREK
ncbi:MAG: hypothetical protein ABSD67_03790 [Terracidiphilus sp.]